MQEDSLKLVEIYDRFLEAQEKRLKPRTYRDYASVIGLFEAYMNKYAHNFLEGDESSLFCRLYSDEEVEFSDIFGVDKISSYNMWEFIDYFIRYKVCCGDSLVRTSVTVMNRFNIWLKENHFIDEHTYEMLQDELATIRRSL